MKKIINILIIIGIICFTTVCFATEDTSAINMNKAIEEASSTATISVSSKTVGTSTDYYLILNISKIDFTYFKVDITNTSSIIADKVSANVSDLNTNSTSTSFIISKTSTTPEKMAIVFTSPDQESTVTFNVTITNLNATSTTTEVQEKIDENQSMLDAITNQKATLVSSIASLKSSIINLQDEQKTYEEDSEEYATIQTKIDDANSTISEAQNTLDTLKTSEDGYNSIINDLKTELSSIEVTETASVTVTKQSDAWADKEMPDMDDEDKANKEKMMLMSDNMKQMMEKMTGLQTDLDTANMTISSLTSSVTYQGSQNNYLKSLSITGVDFNYDFLKTTDTYFATVGSNVNSVTVNAVKEDSNATVTIYGNTSLVTGKNKILISVTAQDGSVRTYKIYVTKQ